MPAIVETKIVLREVEFIVGAISFETWVGNSDL
jgi:hypothetical protein